MVYLYQGELAIGELWQTLKTGQIGQVVDGNTLSIAANEKPVRCLILAANPLREPMVQSGPFVMSSQEEIEQAVRDYRDGVLAF